MKIWCQGRVGASELLVPMKRVGALLRSGTGDASEALVSVGTVGEGGRFLKIPERGVEQCTENINFTVRCCNP